MNRSSLKEFANCFAAGAGLAVMIVFCSGCSSNNQAAAGASPAAGASKAKAASAEAPAAPLELPRSVFSTDPGIRDPFFPKSRRNVVQAVEPDSAPDPSHLPTVLAEGFRGVVGSGDQRIAIIYNIMLERGRETVIPLPRGQQPKQVTVRCLEVQSDSVRLEVQGFAHALTITRPRRM